MPGEQKDRLGDDLLNYDPWTGAWLLTNPDDEDETLDVETTATDQKSGLDLVDSQKTFSSLTEREDYYRSFFGEEEEEAAPVETKSSGSSSGSSSAPTAPTGPSLVTPKVGEGGTEDYGGQSSSWANTFMSMLSEYSDMIGDLSDTVVSQIEDEAAAEAESDIEDMDGRESLLLTGGAGLLGEADVLKKTLLGGG